MELNHPEELIIQIISVNMKSRGNRDLQSDFLSGIDMDDTSENFLLSLLHLPLNHRDPNDNSHITYELFTEPHYLNLVPHLKTIFKPEDAHKVAAAFFSRSDHSEYHMQIYSEYTIKIALNKLTEVDGDYLILLLNLIDHAVGYYASERFY